MEPRNKELLKRKIEENQRELEEAVHEGDNTLCNYIQDFMRRHLKSNVVPTDGTNKWKV